jgi:hypothetical protein
MNYWNQPGVPHRGWRAVDIIDRGEADANCEMCGQSEVRFLHLVEHPAHTSLRVGCVCAEKMTADYSGQRKTELKQYRNQLTRRNRFLFGTWEKITNSKDTYTILQRRYSGAKIEIHCFRSGYYYVPHNHGKALDTDDGQLVINTMLDDLFPLPLP